MNQTNTLPQKDGPAETLRSSGWLGLLKFNLPMKNELEKALDGSDESLNDWLSDVNVKDFRKLINEAFAKRERGDVMALKLKIIAAVESA